MLGGARVGLDRRDAHGVAEPVADGRREQSDAAVEVVVRGARVEARRRRRGPAPPRVSVAAAPRCTCQKPSRSSRNSRSPTRSSIVGRGPRAVRSSSTTTSAASPTLGATRSIARRPANRSASGASAASSRDRERHGCHGHDRVAAGRVRPDRPSASTCSRTRVRQPVPSPSEVDPRAERARRPARRPRRARLRRSVRARREHLGLQRSLPRDLDVAELGAARAPLGSALDGRLGPDVRATVGGRLEHLDGLGAPEPVLRTGRRRGRRPARPGSRRRRRRPDPRDGRRRRRRGRRARCRGRRAGPSVAGGFGRGAGAPLRVPARSRRGRRVCAMLRAFHSTASPGQDGGMRLYLASTSPARLQTLRAAGVEPIAVRARRRRGGGCRRARGR